MQLDLTSLNDELDEKNKKIEELEKKLDEVSKLAAKTPFRSSSKGRLLHPLQCLVRLTVYL